MSKKKDTILDDILADSVEIARMGSDIRRQNLLDQAASVWGGVTPSVRDTDTVRGNTPKDTETVRDTESVRDTDTVGVTEKSLTDTVGVTEKSLTDTVGVTAKTLTETVRDTDNVRDTESVRDTDTVSPVGECVLNSLSDVSRVNAIIRATSLKIPYAARCLLLQLLCTMRSSKEEISLGALSRLTGTRRATLTESLTTLEQEEIVVVRRLMSSITVDVTPYLGLTESVTPLPRMYVCMNDLYNKQTNKHTEHRLTESVTPLERQAIEYRAEDLLVVLDLLQIIKVTHGTPDVSKKAFKVILKAAASDEDKLTGITIALIAAANGKKNLQAYWVRLMEDKDREELTASALQASKEFLKLCSTLRSKAFENPSFDELKSMGTKLLRLNEKVKTRASLVDYLSLKADELEARLSVYKASLLQ